jgi:hypothetical protein
MLIAGHASGQRIVGGIEYLAEAAKLRPVLRQQIVGFRVKDRISQVLVAVVGEMQCLVTRKWQPQVRGDGHEGVVDEAIPCRVAVQGFMLQRAVKRHAIGADGGQTPPWQTGVIQNERDQNSIIGSNQRHRWPLDCPMPDAAFAAIFCSQGQNTFPRASTATAPSTSSPRTNTTLS